MGFGTNEQRGMDGVRKNEREVHEVKYFRKGGNFFRTLVNLFRKAILIKRTFSHEELMRSSLGRLSVFSRCFEARYKKGEILRKSILQVSTPNITH